MYMFVVGHHQRRNVVTDEAAKGGQVSVCVMESMEMHVMDKMILFRACGNLNLCGATEVSSLGTVLTWTILGHALGFIYIGECSEFGTNHLHCF
jgi:hypothetical protein